MNQPKRRVLLIFGGQSGEHEVSILSATHVKAALDPTKYDVTTIGITKTGQWLELPEDQPLAQLDDPRQIFRGVTLPVGTVDRSLVPVTDGQSAAATALNTIDVVLPILHGPHGEDGTVQGLLELTGLPYVGCGVLASAVAMDKVTAKRVFKDAGIPVVPGQLVLASQLAEAERPAVLNRLERELQYPMFVKPSNLGSSIGISKVSDRAALSTALDMAASYDRRILVESAVPNAREIEVAVLGNDTVKVSAPGEIVPDREFYDYDSKYASSSTSQPIIPAKLDVAVLAQVRTYAEKAFRVIDGAGLSRVDFLLNGETGELFLSEINTMPGFTPISMYTKLWEASGMSYSQLLDELIRLALERSTTKHALKMVR